jgi:hypothetical protein
MTVVSKPSNPVLLDYSFLSSILYRPVSWSFLAVLIFPEEHVVPPSLEPRIGRLGTAHWQLYIFQILPSEAIRYLLQ